MLFFWTKCHSHFIAYVDGGTDSPRHRHPVKWEREKVVATADHSVLNGLQFLRQCAKRREMEWKFLWTSLRVRWKTQDNNLRIKATFSDSPESVIALVTAGPLGFWGVNWLTTRHHLLCVPDWWGTGEIIWTQRCFVDQSIFFSAQRNILWYFWSLRIPR